MTATNELVRQSRSQPDGWGAGSVLPLLGGEGRGEGERSKPSHCLRPVSPEDLPTLADAHEAEGHSCILPTQCLVKNGAIVGAVSLGAVCLVLPWFSKQCSPRDSLEFIRLMETHVALALPTGHPGVVCVPFVPQSPFHPHVQKLGYQSAGLVDLTFKKLR